MGLGLTLTYGSPSLGQLVPVNVFQREFRATHTIVFEYALPFLS